MNDETIGVRTRCQDCKKAYQFDVPKDGYRRWMDGEYIQNAMPGVSEDHRELLMGGFGPCCFPPPLEEGE